MKKFRLVLIILALVAGIVVAQRWGGRRYGGDRDFRNARTAREIPSDSTGTPAWTNAVGFERDVFTFARIRYSRESYGYGHGGASTDCPDSDLNLSFRLQQMTSLLADPDGRVIDLTDLELFDYPWIYIVEAGSLGILDEEVPLLRRYLLNGGFLMVDDFWGDSEWENFYREIKRVFPERELEELSMDHPIFHCVFPITLSKNQMQVPNYRDGEYSQYNGGITWERGHDGDTRNVHFKAIFDDKRRMMVMICHNTDNGDGWEREGEYHYYFKEFSEKKAYPLGINIIFYAMTH
jgi:hypothetical protein